MKVFIRGLYLFLMIGIMTSQSFAQEVKTVFCFGNSLTAGYGLAKEESWPSIIQKKIDEKGYSYNVIQSGLSGETSAGGVSRIKWVLKDPVEVFILELGPNDGLRGLPVSETKKNLERIINYVIGLNPDVNLVIAGMKVPPNMGPEYSEDFDKMYKDLANKYQAHLIPFFLEGVAGKKELNLSDGIHPNKEGQKIVAENVWTIISPIL